MHVYVLREPIDCIEIMMPVEEFIKRLGDPDFYYPTTKEQVIKETSEAEELFLSVGWEGDGNFLIMWMPPFLIGGTGGNMGDFAYFVKQSNNGTCFVCSHDPLPIPLENLFIE